MSGETFKVHFEVRDSELDAQGIVNNACYLTYMEHARNKFLLHACAGVGLIDYTRQGLDFVVAQYHISFKKSLCSKDRFYVTCRLEFEGPKKAVFLQECRREPGDVLMTRGRCLVMCVHKEKGLCDFPQEVQKVASHDGV